MNFKKQFIKNYLKIKLVTNKPGVLQIRIGMLPKIGEQYKAFERNVIELMKILPGITDIKTQFDTGDITFVYDTAVLSDRQLMMWINTVVDVAIDSVQLISGYGESNPDYVMNQLRPVLEQKAKVILAN